MLKIYEESYFQDKRIKALFITKYENAKRKYNKEKYREHINYLLKLGKIAYNENFLNCNAIEKSPKTYRKSSSNDVFVLYRYEFMIPKSINRNQFTTKIKPETYINKPVSLKYLNQKPTHNIYDDTFCYIIETLLRLPHFARATRHSINKQLNWFYEKQLREGKLLNKKLSYKLLQNIEKNEKNNSLRAYLKGGYRGVLTLLSEEQKERYQNELRLLRFKKSETCFFHNVRLKINGKKVILTRDINNLLDKGSYNGIREIWEEFLRIGLIINGIDIRNITTLELVSLECSRELNGFDKSKHRDIPISRYGRDRVRHLIDIGFQNYYCYVDYSIRDILRNKIPEFEIKYVNRNNEDFEVILRDLEFLLDFKPKIDNGIIDIERFEITASILKKRSIAKPLYLEYKSDYEINNFSSLEKSFVLSETWIFSRLT